MKFSWLLDIVIPLLPTAEIPREEEEDDGFFFQALKFSSDAAVAGVDIFLAH